MKKNRLNPWNQRKPYIDSSKSKQFFPQLSNAVELHYGNATKRSKASNSMICLMPSKSITGTLLNGSKASASSSHDLMPSKSITGTKQKFKSQRQFEQSIAFRFYRLQQQQIVWILSKSVSLLLSLPFRTSVTFSSKAFISNTYFIFLLYYFNRILVDRLCQLRLDFVKYSHGQ